MGGPKELPKVETPDWLSDGAGEATAAETGESGDFTTVERAVIDEARTILSSPEFEAIKAAHAAGEGVLVEVGGRTIQYEPGMPAAGFTLFEEDAFVMGREAFATPEEPAKTVLHELHRLATSQAADGVHGELVTKETASAFEFAERAVEEL